MKSQIKTVDDYIKSFRENIQMRLCKIRKIIIEKAPEAVEGMSYGMPAYKTNGKLFLSLSKYIKFH